MTALAELEPYVDTCVDLFLHRIDEFTEHGKKSMDISPWMQYFAFDVLGEVNFGRQLGFLKTGTDVDKNIEAIEMVLKYVSLVKPPHPSLRKWRAILSSVQIGQVPTAHFFLLGNPLLPKLFPDFEKANQVQEASDPILRRE